MARYMEYSHRSIGLKGMQQLASACASARSHVDPHDLRGNAHLGRQKQARWER